MSTPSPVLLLGCLVVVILLYHNTRHIMVLSPFQSNKAGQESYKSPVDAIVTVAMCGFHATEMVQALRKEGQWTGPIYVITDKPEAEDPSLCTPIDVKNNHPTFLNEADYYAYRQGARRFNPEIWSKWHKTQLFHLLPDTVHTVLFLDADILAQLPLADDWLPSVTPVIESHDCELILSTERFYTKIPGLSKHDLKNSGAYWSGMIVVKRIESQKVLKEWSELLVREPFMGRDQGKLTDAIETTDTKLCWLPSHWKHVHNQADVMDRVWFNLVGKGTFRHLASSKKGVWKDKLAQKCDHSSFPGFPDSK
jgi:hypothetical protein